MINTWRRLSCIKGKGKTLNSGKNLVRKKKIGNVNDDSFFMKSEDVSPFLFDDFFFSENINCNIHSFFIHIQFWTCWPVRTCFFFLFFKKRLFLPRRLVLLKWFYSYLSVFNTPWQSPSLEVDGHQSLKKEQAEPLTFKRLEQISACISNSTAQLRPSPLNITPSSIFDNKNSKKRDFLFRCSFKHIYFKTQ